MSKNREQEPEYDILDAIRTGDDMETRPRRWHVPQVFPTATTVLISGREKKGKSTWCSQMATDLALGRITIMDDPETFTGREPLRVMYIDLEEGDKDETNIRLVEMGAREAHGNLATLDKTNPAVAGLTTTSDSMRRLIEKWRPDVLFLLPIVYFLPERCNASSRKDVAKALRPLITMAEEFDCTIVMMQHTNKTDNPDYRKCIADSAYFCDAPRTVLMFGSTQNEEIFVSLEKGNRASIYEPYETRIFKFQKDRQALEPVGTTNKKWRDFVLQSQGRDIADTNKAAAQAERKSKLAETKEIIVKVLSERGSMQRDALINATLELGASTGVWERARKALIDEHIIIADTIHYGQSKTTTYRLANDEGVEVEDVFGVKGGAA